MNERFLELKLDIFSKGLEDNKTFSEYNIKNESNIYFNYKNLSQSYQIFFKTLAGRTRTLNVYPEYSIKVVKLLIYEKEGIPSNRNRLIFVGRELSDETTVAQNNIGKESTLHMTLRLMGGLSKFF